MMMKTRAVAAFSALSLTAACGGGGGGGDNPVAEYGGDSARAGQLVAQAATLDQTAAAAMPTTGRAEYDGIVGMAFGAAPASIGTADMIGEVDLNANFATGQITGEFDDFNTAAGQELRGDLRLSNGQISGTGFTADIAGNLGGAPGAVSGTIAGDFLGANAGAIEGTGSASSDGGALGIVFVGTRDRD